MLGIIDHAYDKCIKCTACVVSCPVANSTLDFGGPKHLGPELKRLIENREHIDDPSVELCTLCGNCNISCPEGVPVTTYLAQAKALHAEKSGTKLRDKLLSQPELIGKIASPLAPITNSVLNIKPIRKMLQKIIGIPAERLFPKYNYRSFNKKYKQKTAKTKHKVAYFIGCYATYNAPEVAEAFIEVMNYNNIEVAKPDQKCCGIPQLANGQKKQAIKNAYFNVASLLEYVSLGYAIVMTCSSCSLAFKREYPELKIAGAVELSQHVYDASEYLRMLAEQGEMNKQLAAIEANAGYFSPCHLKNQGIGNPALDVLELIPNYQIQDLAAGCCGQCGTFGFKEEKYALSLMIGAAMQYSVEELQPDYTVTECGMCKNQLVQLTKQPVKHPMQIMAEAYRSFHLQQSE